MTFAEYKSINLKYIWKAKKSSFLILPVLPLIICSNVFNTFSSPDPNRQTDLFGLIIVSISVILFIGFIFFRYNALFKKNYQNTPILANGITVTLSEQSIAAYSPLINAEQPWPASFKKAIQVDKWILLSSSAAHFYFLDTEKLVSPATLTDVAMLFDSKGVKFIK